MAVTIKVPNQKVGSVPPEIVVSGIRISSTPRTIIDTQLSNTTNWPMGYAHLLIVNRPYATTRNAIPNALLLIAKIILISKLTPVTVSNKAKRNISTKYIAIIMIPKGVVIPLSWLLF
jgi:hypothetical protein